jgi:hypothetical protein
MVPVKRWPPKIRMRSMTLILPHAPALSLLVVKTPVFAGVPNSPRARRQHSSLHPEAQPCLPSLRFRGGSSGLGFALRFNRFALSSAARRSCRASRSDFCVSPPRFDFSVIANREFGPSTSISGLRISGLRLACVYQGSALHALHRYGRVRPECETKRRAAFRFRVRFSKAVVAQW